MTVSLHPLEHHNRCIGGSIATPPGFPRSTQSRVLAQQRHSSSAIGSRRSPSQRPVAMPRRGHRGRREKAQQDRPSRRPARGRGQGSQVLGCSILGERRQGRRHARGRVSQVHPSVTRRRYRPSLIAEGAEERRCREPAWMLAVYARHEVWPCTGCSDPQR